MPKRGKSRLNALSVLFIINGIFTFLGSVILIFFPNLITQNLPGQGSSFLIYLLAASAFSLSVLSFFSVRIRAMKSLMAPVLTFLVFHGLTAISAIIVAATENNLIFVNAAVHVAFFVLFLAFGFKTFKKYLYKF